MIIDLNAKTETKDTEKGHAMGTKALGKMNGNNGVFAACASMIL